MIRKAAVSPRWLLAAALGATLATAHASPELLAQATSLLNEGKAAQAYELLAAREAELAGDLDYDYLLGVAALDAARPDMATLAFERVLAVNPRHAGARLDLGRAWFAMGDLDRAETELRAVQGVNPPAEARKAVEQYLAAIERKRSEARTQWNGYLEAAIGYDTNVNNSTDQSTIFAPIFGVDLQLSATNVESDDGYLSLAGGGAVTHTLRDGLKLYAGADLMQRSHFDENDFDTGSLSGRAGLEFGEGEDVVRVGVNAGRYYQDGDVNRDAVGVSADWRHTIDAANLLALSAQFQEIRYDDAALVTNNVDQGVIGASWLHVLGGSDGKTVLFANLYAGEENDTDGRADGDKDLLGGRLGVQHAYRDDLTGFASLGLQDGDYDRRNAIFLTTREDEMTDLRLGFNWTFAPQWSLRGQLAYINNESNIQIYEYDRTEVSLAVRRDF